MKTIKELEKEIEGMGYRPDDVKLIMEYELKLTNLQTELRILKEVLKIVDEVFKHCGTDDPEHCGCHLCYHDTEYQETRDELIEKIGGRIDNGK